MGRFTGVLNNKDFFLLWLGQVISQFGDRLNQMALIALVSARAPGSTLQLAKVLSFTIIPVFLVGPIASPYVDRWNQRRTMIVSDLLRVFLVVGLALSAASHQNMGLIYVLIFMVFSLSRFFVPAKMAIIPQLVPQNKLLLANSLSSTTGMIAAVLGLGLGGLIVEHIGPPGGFFLDAFTYLISALCITMMATRAAARLKEAKPAPDILAMPKMLKKTLFGDIKEGWQYMMAERDVRFVAKTFFLLWSALGAVYVVIIIFVQRALGSITQDLGILAMSLGSGLFCGALIYGRFGEKLPRAKIIFAALGISGISLSIFTIFVESSDSILFAAALGFILGLAISPIVISAHTLIHEVAKESMRGRIFGMLEIVAHLGFLLFMLLSSFLAERIGQFLILLSVGIILTIIGFGALYLKLDRREAQCN